MANKIKFGLKNTHYAVVTETTNPSTGVVTSSYGTVKAWPGSVNLTLDAAGEDTPFYADDSAYTILTNNSGYTGTFESALIPEDVNLNVLGQTKTSDGLVTETNKDVKKYIAIMTEFQGDESGRRYVFYRCMLTRPSVTSQTTEASTTPQTDTVNITISPRPDDGKVKAYADYGASAYAGFYNAVPVASTP